MKQTVKPEAAYQGALQLIDNKQLSGAERILRQLTAQFPGNLEYTTAMIDALYRQKKTGEAFEVFQTLVDRFNPADDPVYHATYLAALRATGNSPLPLRRMLRFYELTRQLQRTLPLSGDVVECGCFRGMSSYLLCSYLRHHDPRFSGSGYHIFDSFQGLAEPTSDDDIPEDHTNHIHLVRMTSAGAFAAPQVTVQKNLSAFPDIAFHAGWIPLTFRDLPERQYRFVHVDVDLYDPTWDCLEYFYPRLANGGVLVSDDYGWPGAKKAIDEFCAERKIALNVTRYGQAVLVKLQD
jgi:O-methyltransferase